MSKLIPFACLALLGAAASEVYAQTAPAEAVPEQAPSPLQPAAKPASQSANPAGNPAAKPAAGKSGPALSSDGKVLPQITISGARADDMDERRRSTAGKQVYGREELDRNGDSNLGDILKRLPGVTIGGRPGRGGEIRMRGLGNGYTQVLLNGERPPAGFSMDSLSPDQVERVEVMRGPVAEHSTRAIAGTINIVLRDGYQQKDYQLKLTDSIEQGRHAPNVSLTAPLKVGAATLLLSGSIFENRQHDQGQTYNLDSDAAGVAHKEQTLRDESGRTGRGIHFTPRLSYKFDNGDTLNFQPFLMSLRSDGHSSSALSQGGAVPPAWLRPPEYSLAHSDAHSSMSFLRGFGNWIHKFEGAAKLDVKFGFGTGHSSNDSLRQQYDASGVLLERFQDSDSTRDRSFSTGGKYTAPLGRDHSLAAGWDVESAHRSQTKTSLDKNGLPQFSDSGDNLSADTRRLAVFAQDEWDITSQWAAYFGLRWEGIRTTSSRAGGDVSNSSSVFSPLLHGVWRIPGHEKDQLRASLTKSYKAASVQDLIALPALSHWIGDPTRPDRMGNPDLKPELATGLDLAYEHYLGRSGIVSVSGFVRDIDNLIRRSLSQQQMADGLHWVSRPENVGHARTSGVELEAKFQLADLFEDAPALDLRANYSRFWSRVDGIPGPNNRLDQQAKQTANLGLDYRMKGLPLTLGGSFNWTPATTVQTSATQVVDSGRKRAVDLYGLWKFNGQTQLRVSVNNLLAEDSLGGNVVTTNGLSQLANTENQTFRVWSVKLETKF
ncbi:TonB-dependent receptor plug domain-containing protein [Rugamonas rubra]|uniref:Iron complex outermembrane recepter protein n=1 Tax=Rugamonas rubra TaxID=758825 RepID=A0A1I4KBC8_9BURK|nr:TonB-dependent receptor [Rugamonas rubra]SFL76135.1 iron complex outermembrane recepter protein [Rugamonas rubra]